MGSSASAHSELYQPVNSSGGASGNEDAKTGLLNGNVGIDSERIEGIDLEWDDIHLAVRTGKETKPILKGCSGRVRRGEVCCIIGPSGAGKTSLLNVLAGRVRSDWSGSVRANGVSVDPRSFRSSIAYVMQEESLFATSTPREALTFSAAMRLPPSTPAEVRQRRVERLIHDLDLTKCADTMIGSILIKGISGGEKKRTSVAMELVTNPKVIFLDEPTSGLDTSSAFTVVKLLKSLCERGCSVVCTIHQPSSEIFHLFDTCILIESGHIMYNGAVREMVGYFDGLGDAFVCPKNYNPADHVMFLMQDQKTAQGRANVTAMREAWAKRSAAERKDTDGEAAEGKAVVASARGNAPKNGNDDSASAHVASGILSEPRVGMLTQFRHLLVREIRNVRRDTATLRTRAGLVIFMHTLYGLVFRHVGRGDNIQSHYGALVQLSVSAMFGSAQPTILTFPYERPVFLREYVSGSYSVIPYMASKTIVEIPMVLAQTLTGLSIAYPLIQLQGNFIRLWMALFLLGIVCSSIAISVGCMAKNVKSAIEVVPIIFVPQMLFAGFFVQISEIPIFLRWAQWLCTLKYAINLLLLTEFHEETFVNDLLLENASVQRNHYWMYVGILCGLFFLVRSIGTVALRINARTQY